MSATRGIVGTVGENRLGGRIVWVLGPGGQWHYYAHLGRFADVRVGQVIAAGTWSDTSARAATRAARRRIYTTACTGFAAGP